MFSQVSYCKQDKELSRASKEQYENAENKTNHMKIPRCVFKEENLITRGKKKKKKKKKTSPSTPHRKTSPA